MSMRRRLSKFLSRLHSKSKKSNNERNEIEIRTLVEESPLDRAESSVFPFLSSYLSSCEGDEVIAAYKEQAIKRYSPYSGEEVTARNGIFLNKYHAYVFEHPAGTSPPKVFVELLYAGQPFAIYVPHQRTLILYHGHAYPDNLVRVTKKLAKELTSSLAGAPGSEPVLLVGDTRPLHFFGDCVGYLHSQIDQLKLLRSPLSILETPTQSFVNLGDLFGALVTSRNLDEADINNFCRSHELLLIDGHRPKGVEPKDRSNALVWAAKRIQENIPGEDVSTLPSLPPNALIAVLSLDVEKDRFVNQREFCAIVIDRLLRVARLSDRKLVIAWDGWTLRSELTSKKDRKIIGQLNDLSQSIASAWQGEVEFVQIYDQPFERKIVFCSEIDIFFSTYGTASMVAGGMSQKPGFCYHNPCELQKDLPISYRNVLVLNSENARFLDTNIDGEPKHHWPFTFNFACIPTAEELSELIGKS